MGSRIRHEHRLFITGYTQTGKSTLVRALFLSTSGRRIVIDPADSSVTAVPGAITFSDPRRWPDAATLRFVPRDPDDRAVYDALFDEVFYRRFPIWVWTDEPEQAMASSGYPRSANRAVVQGAKRMIGMGTCATRPRLVMVNTKAMASHWFIFDTPLAEDRRHIADNIGISLEQLEALLDELAERYGRHGFLWYDRPARTLTICPPLKVRA